MSSMMTIETSMRKAGEMAQRVRSTARRHWRELVEAEAPVSALAAAFGVGLLVSTIPVPMVDMALAAYIMRRFTRLPRAPFVAAMAMTNSLVMAPLYASTPKVGGAVLHWMAHHTPLAAPEALLIQILVGYLIIALGLALGGYALAGTGFYGYRTIRNPGAATAEDATPADRA